MNFFLAETWVSGSSILCNRIALGLKSAPKSGSRFQKLLVTFWANLGSNLDFMFHIIGELIFVTCVTHFGSDVTIVLLGASVTTPPETKSRHGET